MPVSFSSFRATWNHPTCPYGVISHYSLFYRQADMTQTLSISSNSSYMRVTVPSTMTERLIENLIPYTNYTVHVQAVVEGNLPGDTLPGAITVERLVRTLSTTVTPPPLNPLPTEGSDPTSTQIVISIGDPIAITTGRVM